VVDNKGVGLTPIRKIRLYEEVEVQLMSLVKDGAVKPGEKFPSESVLEKQLNVSRSILREAFRILEAKGLVYSVQGGGRYLRSVEESIMHDNEYMTLHLEKTSIIEIYEVRLGLEPIAAKLAAARRKPEDIESMQSIISELEDKEYNDEEDYPFHMAIAKATGNYVLGKLLAMQMDLVNSISNEEVKKILDNRRMKDYVADDKEIFKAIKAGDGEKAARLMEEHITKSLRLLTGK